MANESVQNSATTVTSSPSDTTVKGASPILQGFKSLCYSIASQYFSLQAIMPMANQDTALQMAASMKEKSADCKQQFLEYVAPNYANDLETNRTARRMAEAEEEQERISRSQNSLPPPPIRGHNEPEYNKRPVEDTKFKQAAIGTLEAIGCLTLPIVFVPYCSVKYGYKYAEQAYYATKAKCKEVYQSTKEKLTKAKNWYNKVFHKKGVTNSKAQSQEFTVPKTEVKAEVAAPKQKIYSEKVKQMAQSIRNILVKWRDKGNIPSANNVKNAKTATKHEGKGDVVAI